MNEKLKQKLSLLPDNPGVYVMLDSNGHVIYVGKAKVLKNRVKQYFHSSVKTQKVMAMVANIDDFYYIITKSERDALSLENNLIKKYKPKYNVLLKDDKTYPYLKINLKKEFPRFEITRKIVKDGSKYFGPFMLGVSVNDVLEIVNSTFMLRSCNQINKNQKRGCLNSYIGLCSAPCVGQISQGEYLERVKKAIDFLNGDVLECEKILIEKMQYFAEREEFELAINFREKLEILKKLGEKKITSLPKNINADIIGVVSNNIYCAINVLFTRKGFMQGSKSYSVECEALEQGQIVYEFLNRFYLENREIPDEIILSDECSDGLLLQNYFKEISGKTVNIVVPKQGVRKQLVEMSQSNAQDYLEKSVAQIEHKKDMTVSACEKLQKVLGLKKYPKRIECYDISNVSGVDKVGSMVVMIDGEKVASEYRRFMIKTVEGANDYASHQEMMARRLEKLSSNEKERFPMPDLMVIDGGKGQLSAVKEVLDRYGYDIEIIALAEREEEIYTLNLKEPIILSKRDYVLQMLQRLRDEAHRFAITYFRKVHNKNMLNSKLDEIEGLGKVKKKSLLNKFKSVEKIGSATIDELMEVEGIGKALAKVIYEFFRK